MMIPLRIWALTSLLLVSLASGQLVNLITPSLTTGTDITSTLSGWTKDKINDGLFNTSFGQSGSAVGYIYVDFGTVQTIKTILITQYIGVSSGVLYDIYIGNTSGTGTYMTGSNTLCCNQCNPSGFLTCEGSGQYLILDNYPAGDSFRISELFAFSEPLAATQLNNAIPTLMSVQSADVAAYPNIFRDHDGVVNSCTQFDVSLPGSYLTFELPSMSQVSYVMMQMDGSISAEQVDVDIYDASLTWQPCSQMDFTTKTWDQSSCAGLGGTKIKMTFTVNQYASNVLRKVCKIGVFGQSCATATPVLTENSWTISTTTINLLQDTSVTVPLPSLTITPTGCFSNQWNVYDQSTSTDQAASKPMAFTATNLIISHDPTIISQRKVKFNSWPSTYYFEGTLDDSGPTVTSQFNFNIVFQDDCRTATISAQTITFPNAEWSVQTTQSISVPAFGDSVELGGGYAQGTCGEKDIVLNSPPAFISLTKGTSPLTDPFTIDYDQTSATEADIGIHTISYTVTMTQYPGPTTPISGSFTFEIECPQVVPSVTENPWTASTTTIDLLQDTSATVTLPTVTFSPASCFSMTWKSHDQATNIDMVASLPSAYSLSATDLTISHTPTDFAQRLAKANWATTSYFEGTFDDSGPSVTSQFNFNLVFQDDCRTGTITAQTITVPNAMWSVQTTQSTSVPVFGDSVESSGYAQGTCGEKNIVLTSPPSFLWLTKGTDPLTDPFTIDYDQTTATEADIGPHTISYTVTMTEYSAIVAPITGSFTFEIDCPTSMSSFIEDPWTVSTTTINLLLDSTTTVPLPSLTISPVGCFISLWKVYDQPTSTDQEVTKSVAFTIGATDLTILHDPNKYAQRLAKFLWPSTYYFEGTLDDSVPTVTSQFNFNIVFQDDCRTATISAQTITFPNAEWSVQTTQSISVPAFGDSVELGGYAQGTCGEKDIVLNTPPAFISLTKGTDPLTDPFTIDYDQTAATEADIGIHTISYTVTMTEYAALTTPISGSFTFEIECPQVVPTVTESPWTASTTTIDLLQDTSATVTLPTVTFSPANCFSMTWKSHDQTTNSDLTVSEPATFSLSATDLTFSHTPTDFAQRLAKFQWATTYYFEGTLDDSALTKTSQFNFNIVFQDVCRTASISAQTITVPNVEWYFKSTQSTSVPAFGDSVELGGGYAQGTCGEKDIVLNSPPAFISLTKGTDPLTDPFTIDYDQSAATEADIGIHTISYTVTMTEYAALTTPISGSFTFEIECPILVATFNLDVPIVAYSDYDVGSNVTLSLTPPLVSVNPGQCHSVTAYTVVDSATQVQPDYLTMSALSYDIISSNRTLVGIQTLSLNAVISNGQTIQVQTFQVNFFDSCNATTFIENQKAQTVEIGALSTTTKTINLAAFTDQVSLDYGLNNTCGNFTYQVLAPESAFASVTHIEGSASYEVTFDTKDYSKSGKQTVKVEVGLVNYPLLKSQALITVDVNSIANPFVPPDPDEEKKEVKEPQPLPEIIEDDIQPKITTTPVISIPAPIIQVKVIEEVDLLADAIRQGVSEDQISFPNPVPYISSISQTGLVQIKFTKPLKEISDKIDLNTLEFEFEPEVWMPVLQFYIEPAEAQDATKVAMTWSILKFDSNQMDVQLYFEQPLYVSFEDEADVLVAHFADEELFITENGIKILPDNRTLRRKLRRQLPASAQGVQDTIESSAENTKMTTILILAGNIFLAVGLQQLFSMISALQIIILLTLFNSKMPANTGTFFGQLMQIAAFDLFELDPYINEYLEMEPSDPINEKFETIGLESIYFMNNLGTFTVVIILKLQLIILWILLMMPAGCCKRATKVRDKLGRKIFWNSWLVAVIESFLIISLCIAISFKHSIHFQSFGEIVQSSFCIGCLLIYSLLPLFTLYKVIKDFKEVGNSSMLDVFGAFYIEIQVKNGKKVLIQPTLQLLRRVFLVYIVVYGTQVFYYQMVLMMAATLILGITSYWTESFKTKYDQRLYTFTTMTIMVTCYSFVCFDIVDVETNFTAGYVPIGVISFYIVVVLCMIIFSALKVIRRKIQLKCAQRSHKRQRKLLKGYLDMNRASRKARLQARLRPTIFQLEAPDKEVSASVENESKLSGSDSSSGSESSSGSSGSSNSSSSESSSSSSSSSSSDSSSLKTDPLLKSSDDIQHLVDEILLEKQNELKSLQVSKPTRYALKQVMPEQLQSTDEDISYAINTLEELKQPQRMVATQPRSREMSMSAEQNNLMQTSLQSLKHKMAVKRESQRSMIQTDIDVIMDQVDDILGPQPYATSKQGGAMVPHFEKERYSIETQDVVVVPQRYSKAAHERGRNSRAAQVTQKPLVMKSKIRQRIQVAQPETKNNHHHAHLQEFKDERNNTYDQLDARVRRRLRIVNLHEKKDDGITSFEQWQKNQYKPSFK